MGWLGQKMFDLARYLNNKSWYSCVKNLSYTCTKYYRKKKKFARCANKCKILKSRIKYYRKSEICTMYKQQNISIFCTGIFFIHFLYWGKLLINTPHSRKLTSHWLFLFSKIKGYHYRHTSFLETFVRKIFLFFSFIIL